MKRAVILVMACLLFGALPALSGSPDQEYLKELRTRGYSTDDDSLRALVRSESEPDDARYKAAFLLAVRGVQSASVDIRAALASPSLSDRALGRMANALLDLDPVGAVEVVVETSGKLKDFEEKLLLAYAMAAKGQSALYPTLLEGLKRDGWNTRHWALSGVATLAGNQPPGALDPDPFAVLAAELSVEGADAGGGARIRREAIGHLVEVLCTMAPPTEERIVAALAALHASAERDGNKEVRAAAAAAVESIAEGVLTDSWSRRPGFCHDPLQAYELRLQARGRSVEDAGLRALLASVQEPGDDRIDAALLLASRKVEAAVPEIRTALLSSGFPDRDLALLAHALLELDGAEAVKLAVETSGQLKDPALKLYLARDLAQRGEPALYPILVDHLKQGSLVERHIAARAVGELATGVEPGTLQPDPVETLRRVATDDPAPEVRRSAAQALEVLEKRSPEGKP